MGILADQASKLKTTRAREILFEDRCPKRISPVPCIAQQSDCTQGIYRFANPDSNCGQTVAKPLSAVSIVVYHKHFKLSELAVIARWKRSQRFFSEPHREYERASLANLTFDLDQSSHPLCELPADCKPESCPPVLARHGRVGLGERFEKQRFYLRVNSDSSVSDCAPKNCFCFRLFKERAVDCHMSGVSELNRVSNQI